MSQARQDEAVFDQNAESMHQDPEFAARDAECNEQDHRDKEEDFLPSPIRMCSDLQLMCGISTFAVRDAVHFFQVIPKKGWHANEAIVGYYRTVSYLKDRKDFVPSHFTSKDAVWICRLIMVVGIPEIPYVGVVNTISCFHVFNDITKFLRCGWE